MYDIAPHACTAPTRSMVDRSSAATFRGRGRPGLRTNKERVCTRHDEALPQGTTLRCDALRHTGGSTRAMGLVVALALSTTASHASHAPSYSRHTFELGPMGYRVGAIEVVDINQDGLDDIIVLDDPPREMEVYMASSRLGQVDYYRCGPFPVPGGRDLVARPVESTSTRPSPWSETLKGARPRSSPPPCITRPGTKCTCPMLWRSGT